MGIEDFCINGVFQGKWYAKEQMEETERKFYSSAAEYCKCTLPGGDRSILFIITLEVLRERTIDKMNRYLWWKNQYLKLEVAERIMIYGDASGKRIMYFSFLKAGARNAARGVPLKSKKQQ